MRCRWIQKPISQLSYRLLGRLSESDESETSTLTSILISHYGNVNYLSVLREVPFNITLYNTVNIL